MVGSQNWDRVNTLKVGSSPCLYSGFKLVILVLYAFSYKFVEVSKVNGSNDPVKNSTLEAADPVDQISNKTGLELEHAIVFY